MNRFTIRESYDLLSIRPRAAVFIIHDEKLIVGLFPKGTVDGKPYMAIPGGGVDKEDVNEEATVIRECKEEIGCKLKNIKFICSDLVDYSKYYGGKDKVPDTIEPFLGRDGFKTFFFKAEYDGVDKSLYGDDGDAGKPKLICPYEYCDYLKMKAKKYIDKESCLGFLLKQEIEVMKKYILK